MFLQLVGLFVAVFCMCFVAHVGRIAGNLLRRECSVPRAFTGPAIGELIAFARDGLGYQSLCAFAFCWGCVRDSRLCCSRFRIVGWASSVCCHSGSRTARQAPPGLRIDCARAFLCLFGLRVLCCWSCSACRVIAFACVLLLLFVVLGSLHVGPRESAQAPIVVEQACRLGLLRSPLILEHPPLSRSPACSGMQWPLADSTSDLSPFVGGGGVLPT